MPDTARRNLSDERLTEVVLESFENAQTPRIKEVMQSLVKHLHAFATDVQLTEEEWAYAIDFLTRTGHITDDKRQEFILLSDVLGLSMQVIGINHPVPDGATENTVFGPFFVADSPAFDLGDDIANGASGTPCWFHGDVRGVDGEAIAGANLEIWMADDEGNYDVQYAELDHPQGRGHISSSEDGRYWFWSVLPEAYPIPHDGPVGDLLKGAGRHPMRPAHI
ncbi:MAG TPA: dioxygenase, partial [Caulobacteraceae bacterium]